MEDRFSALNRSIWDSVKEEQVKLGYRKEVIRLYYPIDSVERMLDVDSVGVDAGVGAEAGPVTGIIKSAGNEDSASAGTEAVKGTSIDEKADIAAAFLDEFRAAERDTLGDIKISRDGERYCFRLPEEASEYVHEHTASSGFLYDFIDIIGRHGISIEDVKAVFIKYSDRVHIEKLQSEDFDYLIYFENGEPDDYRYCLTDEGHHIIYHRFTPEDYAALGIGR